MANKWANAIGAGLTQIGKSAGGEAFSSGLAAGQGLAGGIKNVYNKITDKPVGDRPTLQYADDDPDNPDRAPSRKKGGRIKRTGTYKLHAGEFVVPAKDVKRLDKLRKGSRKSGRR